MSERPPVVPAVDPRFGALDARFHAILANLLEPTGWPRDEFEFARARACGVMPAGALDAVNEWAYDLFNDPIVVEQGDLLHVQSHLLRPVHEQRRSTA